jgi:hypothetical protein
MIMTFTAFVVPVFNFIRKMAACVLLMKLFTEGRESAALCQYRNRHLKAK